MLADMLLKHCESKKIPFNMDGSRQGLNGDLANESDMDEPNFVQVQINAPMDIEAKPNSSEDSQASSLKAAPSVFSVTLPNVRVKIATFITLEIVTMVFFTIDGLLRVCSCPNMFRYFMSPINIADVVALVASYVNMYMFLFESWDTYNLTWVNFIQYIQTIRALRLFRIVSNVKAGRVLWYTLRSNSHELLILLLFIVACMATFASIFYLSEGRNTVPSIPNAWYWAVITMTTVGYGDLAPRTAIGRLAAILCAVSGVILFALTVPLFANHFMALYSFVYSPVYQPNTRSTNGKALDIEPPADNEETSHSREKDLATS